MNVGCQALPVPDIGTGPGPWASPAWIPNRLKKLTRIGLGTSCTAADLVIVVGAANNADPIVASLGRQQGEQPLPPGRPKGVLPEVLDAADPLPPNALGIFTGGGAGQIEASLNGGLSACPYYAVVRYASPIGKGPPAPTTGAVVELVGELDEDSSLVSFAWQVTLAAGVASNLTPPAWQANHTYAAGAVVTLPNGAYAMYTTGGLSGATAPAPAYALVGLADGSAGALMTTTSPAGFQGGMQWENDDGNGNAVFTGGSSAVSPTTGFGPIANGAIVVPKTQPSSTFVYSASGGVITVQGWA